MNPETTAKLIFSKLISSGVTLRSSLDLYPSNLFLQESHRPNLLGQGAAKDDELEWDCHIIRIPETLASNVSPERIQTLVAAAAGELVKAQLGKVVYDKNRKMYYLESKGWARMREGLVFHEGDKIEIYAAGKSAAGLSILVLVIIGRIPEPAPTPIAVAGRLPNQINGQLSVQVAALEEALEDAKKENQLLRERILGGHVAVQNQVKNRINGPLSVQVAAFEEALENLKNENQLMRMRERILGHEAVKKWSC